MAAPCCTHALLSLLTCLLVLQEPTAGICCLLEVRELGAGPKGAVCTWYSLPDLIVALHWRSLYFMTSGLIVLLRLVAAKCQSDMLSTLLVVRFQRASLHVRKKGCWQTIQPGDGPPPAMANLLSVSGLRFALTKHSKTCKPEVMKQRERQCK